MGKGIASPHSFDDALVAALERREDGDPFAQTALARASTLGLQLQCKTRALTDAAPNALHDYARVWEEAASQGDQGVRRLGGVHEMLVLAEAAPALSMEELKQLRRELARRIHPDRLGSPYRETGEQQLKAANHLIDELIRRAKGFR